MYFIYNNVFLFCMLILYVYSMYSVSSDVFVKLENISEIIPPEEYYRYIN